MRREPFVIRLANGGHEVVHPECVGRIMPPDVRPLFLERVPLVLAPGADRFFGTCGFLGIKRAENGTVLFETSRGTAAHGP